MEVIITQQQEDKLLEAGLHLRTTEYFCVQKSKLGNFVGPKVDFAQKFVSSVYLNELLSILVN